MNQTKFLVLVDKDDKPWGKMEKMEVHQLGLLHRAFSVFLFNSKGELLLQQRADGKYHSGGLWTNTCCSHPEFGEDLIDAVTRRLREEMGLNYTPEFMFSFLYKADFDNGLIEHEFDHVFFGISNDTPIPDPEEVKSWKYITLDELEADIVASPWNYTAWLKECIDKVHSSFQDYRKSNRLG